MSAPSSQKNGAPQHQWRDTLFLPRTVFSMKAGLVKLEEKLLHHWQAVSLEARKRNEAEGREVFILHDGPPYANGDLHLGSGLNKILKDFVNRTHYALGRDVRYVPGWDCHGLPIEWQIEEEVIRAGSTRKQIGQAEMRRRCRLHAEKWVEAQKTQFRRLGVGGDWENPYLTMAPEAQAKIAEEAMKAAASGAVYRAHMPVMWSPVEETALAEAEVEYKEHVSPAIWVRFPLGENLSALIWTTTPWTIPSNRAIAFGAQLTYGVYEVVAVEEESLAIKGEKLLIADSRAEAVRAAGKISEWQRTGDAPDLSGLNARHPLCGWPEKNDYAFSVPLLAADFVEEDAGTGLVHIAPGHGSDDYALGAKHGLEVPASLDESGHLTKTAPGFAGMQILPPRTKSEKKETGRWGEANEAILSALRDKNGLLAQSTLRHDYPHSWRSKAPVVFRAAPQWFISMEKTGLRQKALTALEGVDFYPPRGRTRLTSMVKTRPDWVISRQRAWGVPLPYFVARESGEILQDDKVAARILTAIREEGAQAWFAENAPERFLAPDYAPENYEQVQDILDVWFDSGSTHAFVLEARENLHSPADLYLEGSDQHRGWFQSSLLESCLTRGRAPYRAILTHGFVLDKNGRKMSKSLGNIISPEEVWTRFGADILRLGTALADSSQDMRFGWESINSAAEIYRKIRNGFRFALGNLHHFEESERTSYEAMPDLEKFILHRLAEVDDAVRAHWQAYAFRPALEQVLDLIFQDLSPFYFDIRKDVLYCDAKNSAKRRACRTVLEAILTRLEFWLAPVLCFTAEEAFLARHQQTADNAGEASVHLAVVPPAPAAWKNDALAAKFVQLRRIRRVATGALEEARQKGLIGSSLEAACQIYIQSGALLEAEKNTDWPEFVIISQAEIKEGEAPKTAFMLEEVPGIGVEVVKAEGRRCARSWKVLPDIGADADYPDLSPRDAAAVRAFMAAEAQAE